MRINKSLLTVLLLAMLCLFAYQQISHQKQLADASANGKLATDDTAKLEKDCASKGGLWILQSTPDMPKMKRHFYCFMPPADTGKICSSSSECQSTICAVDNRARPSHDRSATGRCAPGDFGGCIARVENGIEQQARCRD